MRRLGEQHELSRSWMGGVAHREARACKSARSRGSHHIPWHQGPAEYRSSPATSSMRIWLRGTHGKRKIDLEQSPHERYHRDVGQGLRPSHVSYALNGSPK